MNAPQARSEARLAESLATHELTDTLEALSAGDIQMSHARVIAREAPKKHRRSETEFIELCRAYPSDTVARHPFAYVSQQVYADIEAEAAHKGLGPIDAEHELQRAERSGSMRLGTDGMWHLWAKLDFIAGVAKARRAHTGLLIIADYDVVNERLVNPRLDDGTPLSAQMLAEHAIDAKVLPAVFKADCPSWPWGEPATPATPNGSSWPHATAAASAANSPQSTPKPTTSTTTNTVVSPKCRIWPRCAGTATPTSTYMTARSTPHPTGTPADQGPAPPSRNPSPDPARAPARSP